MALLVDTSVWSLALRRDAPPDLPEVRALRRALSEGLVVATGMILLELLRGSVPERSRQRIRSAFAGLDLVEPERDDYVQAAALADTCRQAGVQLGSVDALIAQLAIARDHLLLTTDRDFQLAARQVGLRLWAAP